MDRIDAAAAALVELRTSGQRISGLPPQLRPQSQDEAYAIQDRVGQALGPIGGWKTAPTAGFAFAHIPASAILEAGDKFDLDRLPGAELELEIGLLLARDMPAFQHDYTAADVMAAVGSVHVVFELLASRFSDRHAVDPLSILADSQNAGAVIIGSGIKPSALAALDLSAMLMELDRDGEVLRSAHAPARDATLQAVADLANSVRRYGGLKAGHMVITGARLGPIPIARSQTARGSMLGLGEVECSFSA